MFLGLESQYHNVEYENAHFLRSKFISLKLGSREGSYYALNTTTNLGVLGYLPANIKTKHIISSRKVAKTRRLCVRVSLGLEDLDTNNVGVGVELELLLLGGSLSWVGGVEDVIKLLKLMNLLVQESTNKEERELTVRFLVSGANKKAMPAWTTHQIMKTM